MADLEDEPPVLIEMAKAIHAYDERQYAASSWEELSPAQREQRIGQANAAMQAFGMHNLRSRWRVRRGSILNLIKETAPHLASLSTPTDGGKR